MTADPTLTAALSQDGAWLFGAMKMVLPSQTLRLLDGSGILTIGGESYAGADAAFGTIAAIDDVTEDMGDEAPEIRFSVFPSSDTALATLASPDMQGSPITLMIGALDPATNALIGNPEVVFFGELDVPTMRSGEGGRSVEYTAVSVFERLFETDEGQRATDGFHQSIWPGELGLAFVTGTTQQLYWGGKPPAVAGTGAGRDRFDRFDRPDGGAYQ